MKQVEFFFDVGSPYSYLAYHQLPKIAQAKGAEIVWRPMLLGGVFQATGNSSPATIPAKGRYSNIDLERWAQYFGVPIQQNPHFPINTLQLMRGAVGMQLRSDAEFHNYLGAIFSAMFEHPRNLGDLNELAAVLEAAGISPALMMALVQDDHVKQTLRKTTEEAVARGVFGAPTFFVGNDMFWGQDRLHFVEQALS
ncbi:2-hydroxychromene-2-carboxylate isomerase [Ralstonia insidiosa]|jgi:2-hydroxychromene-2-carboxylate isomerase|uniref:2-hydroxychromene-2-carboxylate isomerase n=1 Tax=Ralstonia TaxID=48736 RepID=UPI000664855A|nr:2-hydroxychromene-2-carboxylate isomerase [Ralstonia insidiosa]KMW45616.1 DSBA oxidoreductase [Ralstonia sp. MD27]MBX3772452.1 2-hydroxychromene-2-carboxylate isomerase [Ralstonia pickettii]NOZ15657.1 2-hydroxychromene-2-carboxylate isomerase [Betaproteobacteria bacterium]MBA9857108.1 2-hydroxychromene-2-carboxylate isomerase [Ralstonia insidiosa]MBA9870210.1 2-hydroxychromene-2-carboxylate isomerase [Ralstonia insidiosa]